MELIRMTEAREILPRWGTFWRERRNDAMWDKRNIFDINTSVHTGSHMSTTKKYAQIGRYIGWVLLKAWGLSPVPADCILDFLAVANALDGRPTI